MRKAKTQYYFPYEKGLGWKDLQECKIAFEEEMFLVQKLKYL